MNPPQNGFTHVTKNGLLFDRCPKAWLRDEAREANELIRDYRWLKVYNVMPRCGGKLDQDPSFVDAVEILDQEKVKLDGANSKQ